MKKITAADKHLMEQRNILNKRRDKTDASAYTYGLRAPAFLIAYWITDKEIVKYSYLLN